MEDDLQAFLETPLIELVQRANIVREEFIGNKIEICSIVNAKSGLCSQDCKFCAQSSGYNTNILTYSLKTKQEILNAAGQAKQIGAQRIGIVTSGNRLTSQEVDLIAEAAEVINKTGIKVCVSSGVLASEQLKVLRKAGVCRYHHNIETSAKFYSRIVSTHSFQQRVDTIKTAKDLGFEICSGGIIGMGESWQDRIDMAYLLKELDVDSVPLNILIPIKNTPLESVEPICCEDVIRTICIFRIILKDKPIKIAAGRETVLKDFQSLGFMAGANGMIIGGYLTVKGREVSEDHKLIEEIKRIWKT